MKKTLKKETPQAKEIQVKEFPNYYFIGLFLLTTVIFFAGQLFGTSFFWEDFVEYVYPVQTYAALAASQGSIPFWNPYVFSGMPFLADLQVGFFYPLNRLLSFFIDSNGHLSVWGLQFVIIMHFFIAQITFFFLLRSKNISQMGSAIGAIGYSFSMMMVCHVIHPMIVYHLAWFPLVFMFFIRAFDESDYRFGIAAGLILGISMLSGHPQTTLYLAFFLGLYYIWHLVNNIKNPEKSKFVISIVSGAAAFLVALGIFQIQFLTSNELADMSIRAEMTVEKSAEGSLEFKQISNFVNPHQFGKITGDAANPTNFNLILANGEQAPYFYYWETAFYFGIVIVLLGFIGLLSTYKDKFTLFLIIMTAIGFLHALGSNFFVHGIFYNLPFFGQFRNPARMMIYVVFAFSIFAGIGFDKLLKVSFNELKNNMFISIGIVALLVIISIVSGNAGDSSMNSALLGLLYFSISAALAYMFGNNKVNYIVAGAVLTIVLFLDLYLAGSDFNQSKEDPKLAYQMDGKMLESFKSNPPENIFRVNTRSYSPPYMATKRNQGMVDKFMNTEGYNPLVLQRVNPALNTADEIYDLLNVKYVLKFNSQTNQPFFEENFDRLPNAWLVNKAHIFNALDVSDNMKSGNYDFTKEVILEDAVKVNLNPDEEIKSKVVCREYKANYLRYEIMNPETNAILVLSEIWYPAWKVFVDGLPAKLHRANYSLRAIEIPKGASKVELRFASESFALGQWITIVTLLISLPLLVINLNKKK
ncbi:MAG: hypothetical protein KIT33_01540 [Candidatus Kapabacteria bacterium]|nr:hypothetical protein [Ignavibacteriota bacterium]MCW5883633.1 hypothetical protein [Candidatus Kapabacteria bacterium]